MTNDADPPTPAPGLGGWLDDTDFVETPEGFGLDDDDPWSEVDLDEVDLTDDQQAFLRRRRSVVIGETDFEDDEAALLEEIGPVDEVDPG